MTYGTDVDATSSGPLIGSDRVEGTKVFDTRGESIGSIKRLMLEKQSGRVAYAVMTFGSFLGMGGTEQPIPWDQLDYDLTLGGYRTGLTKSQLEGAPTRDPSYDLTNRDRERELRDYYDSEYYWEETE